MLALLSNGTVMAWGDNNTGELGDGAYTDSDVPVAVSGLTGVTAVAAGGQHALALLSNGTASSCGDNEDGQLGDGSETSGSSNVPVAVVDLTGAVAVSAGYQHSLALLSSGAVMAWGDGAFGQIGSGTTTGAVTPTAVTGPPASTPSRPGA